MVLASVTDASCSVVTQHHHSGTPRPSGRRPPHHSQGQAATSLTTQTWSAVEWVADTQLARPSVLLGLRHALAGILKTLHLTGSEPQSRMWRDGNSYSATKGRAVPCSAVARPAARLSRIDWLSSA